MTDYTITFRKDHVMEKYLKDALTKFGSVEITYEENNATLLCRGVDRSVFNKTVSEAAVIRNKYAVVREVYGSDFTGVLPCAFLGALLGQELEKEIEKVKNRLPNSTHLNTNGMFLFLMADLEYSWRTIAFLSKQLFLQCLDDEDYISLIKYFLSDALLTDKTVVLEKDGLYYEENGEEVVCMELFDDMSENAAFNALLKTPSGVIIPTPKDFSPSLIDLIKKLGE